MANSDERVMDLAIIGGGPAGLFAAFYAGLREMDCTIFDSLPELGGQLAALYPEKYIHDVAGFPSVRARELVDRCVQQAMRFEPGVRLEETVRHLDREGDLWRLETNKGLYRARTVIIAAGLGAFSPRRLPVDGSEQWEGKGLYYGVGNLESFRGQRVVIVGGGDSAVDWALHLLDVAESVTLVHRRDGFRAHEESVNQLRESRAVMKLFYEVRSIQGDDRIKSITIFHNKTGEEETLPADAVVASIGYLSSLGPIADWGLEFEGKQIKVNSRLETNLPGVFACGDICTYPGKIKLIACAFGEAPIAVSHAKLHIDPKARLQPAHSSEGVQ